MTRINRELSNTLEGSDRKIDKLKREIQRVKHELKVAHRTINQLEKNIERIKINSNSRQSLGLDEILDKRALEVNHLRGGGEGLEELEKILDENKQKLTEALNQRRQYLLEQFTFIKDVVAQEMKNNEWNKRLNIGMNNPPLANEDNKNENNGKKPRRK